MWVLLKLKWAPIVQRNPLQGPAPPLELRVFLPQPLPINNIWLPQAGIQVKFIPVIKQLESNQ